MEPTAPGTEEPAWPTWVTNWVMPFLDEVGLWPVAFAMLGHVVVILGPLVLAFMRGVFPAAVPLMALIVGSLWLMKTELSIRRSPGPVAAAVVLTWIGSVGLALLGARTGVI